MGKIPLPSAALLAWTMRDRGSAAGQAIQFGIGGMNIMRHDRVRATESETFVHRQIVGRPGKQARNLRNLFLIFVEVSLKDQSLMFPQQRLANLQHRFGRGERKARSDGVSRAAVPMETLDQQSALAIRAVRRLM